MVSANPLKGQYFYLLVYISFVKDPYVTVRPELLSQINITYIDIDLTKTESTDQYEYTKVGLIETYTAKPGFAIAKYSEGTDVKWESDGLKYLNEIQRIKRLDPPTSKDKANTPQSTSQSQVGVRIEKGDDYLKYNLQDGIKFGEVKYGGLTVWKHDSTNAEDPYPESVYFTIKGKTAILNFKEFKKIFRFVNDQWKSIFSGKPRPLELDIAETESTVFEYVKKDKVHTFTAKDSHLFYGVKKTGGCTDSEELIWIANYSDEYATKVVLDETDSSTPIVEIHQLNGLIKKYVKKSGFLEYETWKESWTWKEVGTTKEFWTWKGPTIWEEFETIGHDTELEEDKVEIVTEGQPPKEEDSHVDVPENPPIPTLPAVITPTHLEPESNKEIEIALKPVTHGGVLGLQLDVEIRQNTDKFDYSQSYGFWTYTAKDGFRFSCVKDGPDLIWEAKYFTEYAIKVIVDLDLSSSLVGLTLHLSNKETKRLQPCNGAWEEKTHRKLLPTQSSDVATKLEQEPAFPAELPKSVPTSIKALVDLDIEIRENTNQFNYVQSYGFWTYTAKDGFGFNAVVDLDEVVWRGEDDSVYAIKVVVDLGESSDPPGLTIHLSNGEKEKYKFSGDRWGGKPHKTPQIIHPTPKPMVPGVIPVTDKDGVQAAHATKPAHGSQSADGSKTKVPRDATSQPGRGPLSQACSPQSTVGSPYHSTHTPRFIGSSPTA